MRPVSRLEALRLTAEHARDTVDRVEALRGPEGREDLEHLRRQADRAEARYEAERREHEHAEARR